MSGVTLISSNGVPFLVDEDRVQDVTRWRWFAATRQTGGVYLQRNTWQHGKQRCVLLHRYLTDAPDGLVVDHLNHNTTDNRLCNLRICTQAENLRNRYDRDIVAAKRAAICRRFLSGETLVEIGNSLGVSKQCIGAITRAAGLRRVRASVPT